MGEVSKAIHKEVLIGKGSTFLSVCALFPKLS
jgi:hypothetical protein